MMFIKTRNIDTAFHLIRMVCLVSIIGNIGAGLFFFLWAGRMVDRSQSRVYILSAGKAFEAFASDRKENLLVEGRSHIAMFHDAFFTLDPDERFIGANTRKAFYLADESAKRIYDNLKESGFYSNVISSNITQRVVEDSVVLDLNKYPFHFKYYGTETITRWSSIVTRTLVTEGFIREMKRNENNPHGFLIEGWAILENKDVKVERRQ